MTVPSCSGIARPSAHPREPHGAARVAQHCARVADVCRVDIPLGALRGEELGVASFPPTLQCPPPRRTCRRTYPSPPPSNPAAPAAARRRRQRCCPTPARPCSCTRCP